MLNTDFLSCALYEVSEDTNEKLFKLSLKLAKGNSEIANKLAQVILQHAQVYFSPGAKEKYVTHAVELINDCNDTSQIFFFPLTQSKFLPDICQQLIIGHPW